MNNMNNNQKILAVTKIEKYNTDLKSLKKRKIMLNALFGVNALCAISFVLSGKPENVPFAILSSMSSLLVISMIHTNETEKDDKKEFISTLNEIQKDEPTYVKVK